MAAPWAAPDAQVEEAAPTGGPASAVPDQTAAGSGALAAPPVPPADLGHNPFTGSLGPMTAGDALDGAFALLRSRPRAVVGIAALFVVPLQFLGAFVQRSSFGTGEVADAFGDPSVTFATSSGGAGANSAATLVVAVGMGLALSFICGAYAKVLAAWYGGGDLRPGDAVRGVLRLAWPLAAGWFLVHLVAVPASCLMGAGIFLTPLYLVLAPAIAVERVGPIEGIRRAWFVGTKRYGAALLVALLSGLVATLLSYSFSLVPTVLVLFVGNELGWLLVAVVNSLAAVLGAVAVAGATALFYFDARVRLEGLDLVLAASDALPRDA